MPASTCSTHSRWVHSLACPEHTQVVGISTSLKSEYVLSPSAWFSETKITTSVGKLRIKSTGFTCAQELPGRSMDCQVNTGLISGKSQAVSTPIRYKVWSHNKANCAGKIKRNICIIGSGDLWRLKTSYSLFVNKLHADYSPLAYSCLEQWIEEKVQNDRAGKSTLDLSYYSKSRLAQNHLPNKF